MPKARNVEIVVIVIERFMLPPSSKHLKIEEGNFQKIPQNSLSQLNAYHMLLAPPPGDTPVKKSPIANAGLFPNNKSPNK